jgi:hypothetical protein
MTTDGDFVGFWKKTVVAHLKVPAETEENHGICQDIRYPGRYSKLVLSKSLLVC